MGVREKLTAIADKIRARTRKADGLDLDEMAQGVDEVFEAGKKAEYDAFWDTFQENGERTQYEYGFAGSGWTDENFKPKYDIRTDDNASYMFRGAKIVNMKQCLEYCGVSLDLSKTENCDRLFINAQKLVVLPKIDLSSATACPYIFANCYALTTIEELRSSEKTTFTSSTSFTKCNVLTHLIMTGVLATNGLNLQWSTLLDKESITSIVNALSTTTSGLSVTLSKTAVNAAFETSAGAANGSASAEWTALAGTKSNWTINLV